ncbi:hypothetical protein PROVALCAL_03325 [Providencia alcalifaciens DSM 30120]|uniref:Uncharacterized protein n=1 Tax=Providencia alcalifaciens DSM 30120 TaxID=520999 RepID=B6XIX6_9GAMM|nr:hypothetical protein PROVALCAL_03325 [Providencia alcalifaciens DSM 30120]
MNNKYEGRIILIIIFNKRSNQYRFRDLELNIQNSEIRKFSLKENSARNRESRFN